MPYTTNDSIIEGDINCSQIVKALNINTYTDSGTDHNVILTIKKKEFYADVDAFTTLTDLLNIPIHVKKNIQLGVNNSMTIKINSLASVNCAIFDSTGTLTSNLTNNNIYSGQTFTITYNGTYFVISDITEELNKINSLANPNILINSNFTVSNLVNQRGTTNYSTSSVINIFDCWNLWGNGVTNGYVADLTGQYLTLTNSASGVVTTMNQNVEDYQNYIGIPLTTTIAVRGATGTQFDFGFGGTTATKNPSSNSVLAGTGDWEIFTNTTIYDNTTTAITMSISMPTDGTMEVKYIKGEVGSVSTQFIDDDMATKMMKCQRRLFIIQEGVGVSNIFAIGFSRDTTGITFPINFPVTMRIVPVLDIVGSFRAVGFISKLNWFRSDSTSTVFSDASTQSGGLQCQAVGINSGMTFNEGEVFRADIGGSVAGQIIFNAEL